MDGDKTVNEQDRCSGCGAPLRAGARFCTGCGTPSSGQPDDPAAPQAPDGQTQVHVGYQAQQGGYPAQSGQFPGTPQGYPQAPGHYSSLEAGYAASPGGYPGQPGGYQAVTPGYPNGPGGYPLPLPAHSVGASDGKRTGWLIGGVVAATLAVAGIGVGIYLAVSGGSSGQTRLLSTPSVSVIPASAKQSPSPATPTKAVVHTVGSSAPLPPSVSDSTTAPLRHVLTQASETRAVADTIQRHFSLISEHNFSAAYALLAPSLQTGESSWVASHREDGIYSVKVAVDPKLQSSDSATATIVNMTTLDGHGCKSWSGSWGLTKLAGQWRISESNISSSLC